METRSQSLKKRWNMPSVGDRVPQSCFHLKKRKKTLLTGIYSPPPLQLRHQSQLPIPHLSLSALSSLPPFNFLPLPSLPQLQR
jgi:hypothetical protein